MRRLAIYGTAAALALSGAAAFPAQAAVKAVVINGSNGNVSVKDLDSNALGWLSAGCNINGIDSICTGGFQNVMPGLPEGSCSGWEFQLPETDCSGWEFQLPETGCSGWEFQLPETGCSGWEFQLPETDCSGWEFQFPEESCPGIIIPGQPGTSVPGNPDTSQPGGGGNPDINRPTTPEQPPTEIEGNDSYVNQVVALVNAERAKAGLSPLTQTAELSGAAATRAEETSRSFSHTRPDGSSFSTVLSQNGISYRGSGENIAYGQRTPEQVMEGWMNSQGHRANILNSRYTAIGVGYYQDSNGTPYWTQLFTY